MASCNPIKCVHSSNISHITCTKPRNTSIKTLFHYRRFKKSSHRIQSQTSIHRSVYNRLQSSARFQRIKGTNIVREVNPIAEDTFKTDSTNNYDMTIFHDDKQTNVLRRQSKKIPRWARKSQLQLAFINQVYFKDNNPEDIFGSVQIDVVREMVQSIVLCNTELPYVYSLSVFPANFV